MSNRTPDEVLRSYFAAEMTRDVDAIMAHFSEEAVFTSPVDVRRGHDEIRPFYVDAGERFPSLHVTIRTGFDNGVEAVAEWEAVLEGPDRPKLVLNGVNVAKVVDGKIVDCRSYYDIGTYRAA